MVAVYRPMKAFGPACPSFLRRAMETADLVVVLSRAMEKDFRPVLAAGLFSVRSSPEIDSGCSRVSDSDLFQAGFATVIAAVAADSVVAVAVVVAAGPLTADPFVADPVCFAFSGLASAAREKARVAAASCFSTLRSSF